MNINVVILLATTFTIRDLFLCTDDGVKLFCISIQSNYVKWISVEIF